MIALLCCVCYDKKQTKPHFFYFYKSITRVQKHKMLNILFETSYTYKQNRKDRVMSDNEDVIQALVVLLLYKGYFGINNCSRDLSCNSRTCI